MMRTLRDSSIGRKLTGIIMITCCASLLLAATVFIVYDLSSFRSALVEKVDTMAKVTGNTIVAPLIVMDRKSVEGTLKALRAEPHVMSACVFSADGKLFARYLNGDSGLAPSPDRSDPCSRPENPRESTNHELFVNKRLEVSRRIQSEGEHAMIGVIYINSDLSEMDSRLGTAISAL